MPRHSPRSSATTAGRSLEPHWRDVLLGQFHDILPGSTIERVAREARESLERIDGELDAYVGSADRSIAEVDDAGGPAPSTSPGSRATSTSKTERGLVPRDRRTVRERDASSRRGADPALTYADDAMSNGILIAALRADRRDRLVRRRRRGRALGRRALADRAAPRPVRLAVQRVGHRPEVPAAHPAHAAAAAHRARSSTARRSCAVRPTARDACTIEQRVVLEAGSDVVRFETTVEWHARHRMLRAEFRPAHVGQTGALRDPVRAHRARHDREHRWSRPRSSRSPRTSGSPPRTTAGGFALLNDSKYGHRAKNGLISLNLLRAPTYPDPTADRGTHTFTLRFRAVRDRRPGEGDPRGLPAQQPAADDRRRGVSRAWRRRRTRR